MASLKAEKRYKNISLTQVSNVQWNSEFQKCSIFTKDDLSCFFSHQQLKLLHKEMMSRYGKDFVYIVSAQ